jgi:hypothetical protein
VTIPVGLDDRYELRGLREGRAERPYITLDRIEVDDSASGSYPSDINR